jgi:phosphoenolpyruvate carboxylase
MENNGLQSAQTLADFVLSQYTADFVRVFFARSDSAFKRRLSALVFFSRPKTSQLTRSSRRWSGIR